VPRQEVAYTLLHHRVQLRARGNAPGQGSIGVREGRRDELQHRREEEGGEDLRARGCMRADACARARGFLGGLVAVWVGVAGSRLGGALGWIAIA